MIRQFEGRRPPSLDLFLEYGVCQKRSFIRSLQVIRYHLKFESSPFVRVRKLLISTNGFEEMGSDPADAEDQVGRWGKLVRSCGSSAGCG